MSTETCIGIGLCCMLLLGAGLGLFAGYYRGFNEGTRYGSTVAYKWCHNRQAHVLDLCSPGMLGITQEDIDAFAQRAEKQR